MSAKQLLLGHKNIEAKAFLEMGSSLKRAAWGVTLFIFLTYFGIFLKIPVRKQVETRQQKIPPL